MSNLDDYQAKLETIQAIPEEKIKSPNIPVNIYLQESENLYQWCQDDKDKLSIAGLDWELVVDLPMRTGALRQAESLWFKERFTREEAEREWKEKSPVAYDLRNELLHDFHFAYRKHSDLANRVSAIAEGSGHADMIQDLNDLSELGKANSDPLTAIGFDLTRLDEAAATSDEMAELLSRAASDRADNNEAKVIRDKAYTFLKEAVDEIRDYGQYVFWRDENRLKGYSSAYYRRLRGKKSAETTSPEEE